MFKYFILRKQQQLFCYFCGIVLAMVLMLLFPSVFRGNGFYLLLSSVAPFWAGLALYTRHIDRMRKPEVSPLVSIRDGIQVVAEVPRHEKARLEWEILRDDEVFRQQRWGSRDFPSKNDKVLWRPRRLWPPEGYYFFRDPYLGSV